MTAPLTRTLRIINRKGLHARASAKFAAVCEQFDATVRVSRDQQTVTGSSLMGLLLLAANQGSEIALAAEGPDAAAALDALSELVANRFDESE